MPSQRMDVDGLGAFNFRVEISGVAANGFTYVSLLEGFTGVIENRAGDQPVVRKQPGRHTVGNVVLRRHYRGDDELWQWYRSVREGTMDRRDLSIVIDRGDRSEAHRYNLFQAWPFRWRLGTLDANTDAVLIEEVELAVEMIERA